MQLTPNAPQLARRSETCTLGHALHVELGLADQLMGEGGTQAVTIVGQVHADMLVKQPRQMPRAGTGDLRQVPRWPRTCRIAGDRILHAMHGWMDVVAAFQPR